MNGAVDILKKAMIEFCSTIGRNHLLVQGAGGNVSWKESDILWIKASGTWLADAREKNIFVPVDLKHLQQALQQGNFMVTPKVEGESKLRPSIETVLHALMPHRIVVHLHAVEILAYLVRDTCAHDLKSLLGDFISWTIVDYYKPGAPLAAAVNTVLSQTPETQVVFLKNHGVVVGGENIIEVQKIIDGLIKKLKIKPRTVFPTPSLFSAAPSEINSLYKLLEDKEVHHLALNSEFFNRLRADWALYPDHVVFLGAKAYVYSTWQELENEIKLTKQIPELVFIYKIGVYGTTSFSKAKQAQLRCYYDVITRQQPDTSLQALTLPEIAELLDWDAEQYRITLAK